MSWNGLPAEVREVAAAALTVKQLEVWKLELAGWAPRRTAVALGLGRSTVIDRLDGAHRRLAQAGVRVDRAGEWSLAEVAAS